MKVLIASLVALLMATCSLSEVHLDDVPCCFSYSRVPIPRRIIATAYITSSSCSVPAVVLVTKKNRLVCADPQAAWVQAHLKDFQKN